MINLQIIDDHKMLAEGIRRLIEDEGIANVTAIYHDLNSGRIGLAASRPDILLLDVHLPDGNGVDFCAEMVKTYPDLKIMMLTSYSEFSIAKRALNNGALGYLLKTSMPEEIIAGIEAVNNGEIFMSDEIDILIKKKKNDEPVWLTAREKEVLKLIAEGLADPEIGEIMFLSRETVKSYRKNLLLKFNAKNSVALVKAAIEQFQI
jgi:DNA-binding NarL/FixJ family response regulator